MIFFFLYFAVKKKVEFNENSHKARFVESVRKT